MLDTLAYGILGITKQNFPYIAEHALVNLTKAVVRSHLEYAHFLWNSIEKRLIENVGKVLRGGQQH